MKKKFVPVIAALVLAVTVTGFVFAESKVDLETELIFTGATSDRVLLDITNNGSRSITVAQSGFYIDEIGSAGSWECCTRGSKVVEPGQSESIEFEIEKAVTHGDNSVLVFFFGTDSRWYLAKTGVNLGFEFFAQHN